MDFGVFGRVLVASYKFQVARMGHYGLFLADGLGVSIGFTDFINAWSILEISLDSFSQAVPLDWVM